MLETPLFLLQQINMLSGYLIIPDFGTNTWYIIYEDLCILFWMGSPPSKIAILYLLQYSGRVSQHVCND